MKRSILSILASILLCSTVAFGQTSSTQPKVTNLIAVLNKPIETKTAKPGDELTLRAISDLFVEGDLVIGRGSQLTGHIVEVANKDKDNPASVLAFSVEKVTLKDGTEIPLQAIVAAVAAPRKDSLSTDPTFGMLHSNEPKMVGGTNGATTSGNLSASSKSSSNAAVATANLTGKLTESTILDTNSQGAVDIEGITITWRLMSPPPVTVVSGKGKNLKLETGTQMLLRMAPPKRP